VTNVTATLERDVGPQHVTVTLDCNMGPQHGTATWDRNGRLIGTNKYRALCGAKHDPEKWTPVFGKDHAQRTS